MKIRGAGTSDATRIAGIHVASWQSAYRGLVSDAILDGMSIARRTQAWEEILAAGRSTTLVASINGAVLGFANYGPARDEDLDPRSDAELNALYVHPAHWSTGVGFALWLSTSGPGCWASGRLDAFDRRVLLRSSPVPDQVASNERSKLPPFSLPQGVQRLGICLR